MKKIIWLLIFLVISLAAIGTYNYYSTAKNTVVVGYLPSNHDSALFVANSMGIFKKEGINVKLVPFRDGSEIIDAANSGLIDVAYCGISPTIMAIDNGNPIKIVASVNLEGSALVVNNNSNIKTLKDLKGANIAIPRKGSVQDFLLRDLLSRNNISINEVNITVSDVSYMPDSLLFNKFDAFIAWEPYPSVSKLEDNSNVLLYSKDIWDGHPCCVVIATNDFAEKDAEDLKKFLRAHVEATYYINSNKDETALIVAKKLGTDVDVEKEGLKHVEFVSIPSDEFINNVFKFMEIQKQMGYVKNNLTKEMLFNLQYLP